MELQVDFFIPKMGSDCESESVHRGKPFILPQDNGLDDIRGNK